MESRQIMGPQAKNPLPLCGHLAQHFSFFSEPNHYHLGSPLSILLLKALCCSRDYTLIFTMKNANNLTDSSNFQSLNYPRNERMVGTGF